ncbi:hypothetical protein RJ639_006415 [Escallonia herrerae]|uniref:Uncharacterized protein n=1 Tax=Escallonia herrerae TaxID=1293975 RepID=A0AA88W5P1_9ASTE|nr:hypothetical protein RJ639_006415 [Escallonia herrerae]
MEIEGQGSDFMDMMLSLLGRDGMLHGHKTEDIVKAIVLVQSAKGDRYPCWARKMGARIRYKELGIPPSHFLGNNATVPCWSSLVPREAMEDCYVAGYYVTKGTRLLVNAWKLHPDPNTWIDPCEFQPEISK